MKESIDSEDFKIYTDITKLPLDENPKYIHEGFNGICTGGNALIDVFSNKRRISKNDLVVIFPHKLARICEISDDFSMIFFKVPYDMFMDVMSGMCRLTPDFFFYMRKHFCFSVGEEESLRFIHFCHLISFRADSTQAIFRRETIMHLLKIFYWDIYVEYKSDSETRVVKYTHKENLAFKFFCLIMEYHSTNREVSFYADKLCISPKYLTMTISQVSGKSAKDWIVEYTILEIKALLRDTSLDIKEVVARTQFANQSLMSRFFRKHTGMSPTQYREQTHM